MSGCIRHVRITSQLQNIVQHCHDMMASALEASVMQHALQQLLATYTTSVHNKLLQFRKGQCMLQ